MSVIWKDGQFLDGLLPHISHDDAGFINGLGVFDSMLAKDNILQDAEEHFARLVHDARVVLGLSHHWMPAFEAMTQVWLPLLAENNLTRGAARIRTVVTGGLSERPLSVSKTPSLIVTAQPSITPDNTTPISCAVVSNFPRVAGDILENCKRLDYTRAFAARMEARNNGADEAILTNTHGNIACGATSNIFIREGKDLITPPLTDGVLAGITRAKIIQYEGAFEESISPERLSGADEIFLTNSFIGRRKVILL